MPTDDPKQLVQQGYDALSQRYELAYSTDTKYRSWLTDLSGRLPAGSTVLDIGCGCGVPVARDLVLAGHQVTGVDISEVQIQRARQLVPDASFIHADATTLDLPPASLDAVVSFYTLIHLPLDEQLPLLERIAGWLRPGGWFLGTMGHKAWTGTEENWLGGGVTMWWSHADAATNRSWITKAGLVVDHEEFVPEDESGHALFRAQRPA